MFVDVFMFYCTAIMCNDTATNEIYTLYRQEARMIESVLKIIELKLVFTIVSFLMIRRPPRSTLLPNKTHFRSNEKTELYKLSQVTTYQILRSEEHTLNSSHRVTTRMPSLACKQKPFHNPLHHPLFLSARKSTL